MDRTRLRARIAALLAKTVANGCTEAEALASAELAAKLMADYAIDQSEIGITSAAAPDPSRRTTRRTTWRDLLSSAIGRCTNSVYFVRGHEGDILFVGREPGPAIAVYLRDVCFRAVETALAAFKRSPFYRRRRTVATRRAAARDFVDGMVYRLIVRLAELFKPVRNEEAFRVAERALAAQEPDQVSLTAKTGKGRFAPARVAGWQAGANVALNHGVQAGAPLAIGERP